MQEFEIDLDKFKIPEIISFDEMPNGIKNINFPLSANDEMIMEFEVDVNMFNKLCGFDIAEGKDTISLYLSTPYRVQKRKHKKKRINKKWVKRYGYDIKFKYINIGDCTFKRLCDNTIEISGNPFEIIEV